MLSDEAEDRIYTVRFDEPRCRDARRVGGKAAGLADMIAASLPVAPGFAVGTNAYRDFLERSGVRKVIEDTVPTLDHANPASLAQAEERICLRIASADLPLDLARAIAAEYEALAHRVGVTDVPVAVRSSATVEDSAGASFAGEFETYVDIRGVEGVLDHVRRCWQSVFAARALQYALEKGVSPLAIEMAVVVQKTVRARAAGVMFTLSPVSGDRSRIVLEASWGLGLAIVGGEVTPDRYVVDKIGLGICERIRGDKRVQYARGDHPVAVPAERWAELCLSDEEVIALAALGKQLERLKRCAQDIEFAVDEELPNGENLILLQCRPETVWSARKREPVFNPGGGVLTWIAGSVGGAPGGASSLLEGDAAPPHHHGC